MVDYTRLGGTNHSTKDDAVLLHSPSALPPPQPARIWTKRPLFPNQGSTGILPPTLPNPKVSKIISNKWYQNY
eukprot:890567-Amphidinium_carterae.1